MAIEKLTLEGYEVYKRGWPDLLAERDGEIRLIEVKPSKNCNLSRHQKLISDLLRTHKLEVEMWAPPAPAKCEATKG